MANAEIVIGSNLGDEGKGTITALLTKEAKGTVVNILTNGGAQRAHSILTEDGNFTFQHFGSGTYHGADNYYSEYYILNPIQYAKERQELEERNVNIGKVYRNPNCMWSTPWDMMTNQIIEKRRGVDKHGSCGMGIWETVLRYKSTVTIPFNTFMSLDDIKKKEYLNGIKNYFETKRIVNGIPDSWKVLWNDENLVNNYLCDCKVLRMSTTTIQTLNELNYDNFIFENGQGLLLSDTGRDEKDKTPSFTGLDDPLKLLEQIKKPLDTTVHYVSRSYMTRHGKGECENEADRRTISSYIQEDRNNHFNEFQDDFRFGELNIESMAKRIDDDFAKAKGKNISSVIDLTHCDEIDNTRLVKDVTGRLVIPHGSALI